MSINFFIASAAQRLPRLLDSLPVGVNVAAAFGLRQLSSSYNGACIRVTRPNDNNAIDIGFVNGTLDVATLLAFAAGGDLRILVWFDQSGNGNSAFANNQDSKPIIVSGGVLQKANGTPAWRSTGAQYLRTNSVSLFPNGEYSALLLAKAEATTNAKNVLYAKTDFNGVAQPALLYDNRAVSGSGSGNPTRDLTLSKGFEPSSELHVSLLTANSSGTTVYHNGGIIANNTETAILNGSASTPLYLGSRNGVAGDNIQGYMSEAVFFGSRLSKGVADNLNYRMGVYYKIPTYKP